MTEPNAVQEELFDRCAVHTATYKEQAYELIRDAILYHRLETGVTYSQDELCQQLGISRTPVREALLELQTEGYVQFARGKGIRVVQLDDTAIREILEYRLILEAAAARLAAQRATDEELREMEACLTESRDTLHTGNSGLCYRIDHRFHRMIGAAARNRRLFQSLDIELNHYLRFEKLSVYSDAQSASDIWEAHRELYEAICSRDPEKAEKAAEKHLKEAYQRTLSGYWSE